MGLHRLRFAKEGIYGHIIWHVWHYSRVILDRLGHFDIEMMVKVCQLGL